MKSTTILGCLIIFLVIGSAFLAKTCNQAKLKNTEQNNVAALTDTLRITRQKDSILVAAIASYQADDKRQFLALKSADSTIIALQRTVNDFKGKIQAAANFTSETKFKVTSKTVVIHDTIPGKLPIYSSDFSLGKWIQGTVIAGPDSITIIPSIFDEYEIGFGYDNAGRAYAEAKTHNPYNIIKTFRAYQTSQSIQKRWGIGAQIGYGILYVPQLKQVYQGITLSVGLSRHLVEFNMPKL